MVESLTVEERRALLLAIAEWMGEESEVGDLRVPNPLLRSVREKLSATLRREGEQ